MTSTRKNRQGGRTIAEAAVSLAIFTAPELAERAGIGLAKARAAIRKMVAAGKAVEYGRMDTGHKLYALACLF